MSSTAKGSPRNEEVGYGRPPKHSQFKPGQSGNPRGRPKEKGPAPVDLEGILDETVTVTKDGVTRKMCQREVALRKILQKAIDKSDLKSILYMIEQFERFDAIEFPEANTNGIVIVPHWMPVAMGSFLLQNYGLPPWSKREIDYAWSVHLATRTEDQRLDDQDKEAVLHAFGK